MLTGPLDLDLWAGALAPDIESVDHRTLGTWSAHGADEMLQHLRSLRELSHDVAARIDDILALHLEASLLRRTVFGTASSPTVYDGRVYLLHDSEAESYITALDAKTGAEIWKTRRPDTGFPKSSWTTPFVWKNSRRTEIVTVGRGATRRQRQRACSAPQCPSPAR